MLTAKSMYRGGELVSALDCDFESYRELGLLCPFCNEPVHLCGETVRQSSKTSKLSYIQPHFKHFPRGDSTGILLISTDFDCEKRAVSAEGRRYLDAIRAERRGQRLELFNRYLWEMLASIGTPKFSEASIKKKYGLEISAIQLRGMRGYFGDWWERKGESSLDSLYQSTFFSDEKWEATTAQAGDLFFESPASVAIPAVVNTIKSTVDLKIHRLIVSEVLQFLVSHGGNASFRYLALAHLAFAATHNKSSRFAIDNLKFCMMITQTMLLVPWQQQLEEKSKLLRTDTRDRAFGKAGKRS